MTQKIVALGKSNNLEKEIEFLLKKNNKGKIKDFVMIYTTSETDGGSHMGRIYHYWFGETTIRCLGLLSRMQRIINDYILGLEE